MRPLARVVPLVVIVLSAAIGAGPLQAPSGAPVQTALDRYVAAPDPAFGWKVLRQSRVDGGTSTLLEMTSQRWLTEREVERPLWTHWITVVRPSSVVTDVALLFITGGSNQRKPPAAPPAWLLDAARETGTIAAELRLVPNQPIVFKDDPARKPRSEDDMIAYTWDKYLRTGDERWPARLPMTKAAVRAMDAVTAFAASPGGGALRVGRFVVAGASKRGWTTWTTAAVDPRVVAIVPAVIDMLNVEPSFVHHYRAYGAWSDAIEDYVQHGIMDWMGTEQFRRLMRIEEPYEYRHRLTLPKLMLNSAGDEFFLPDSAQFYFSDLPGEKHVRYVPNTGHSLEKSDAIDTLRAFYAAVAGNTPRPDVRWTFETDGAIKVLASERPSDVRLWHATNPSARSFRIDVLGPAYRSAPLRPAGPNTWIGRVPTPAAGWTAFFVELTFPGARRPPLKLTSGVRVLPETLPYAAPTPRRVAASGGGAPAGAGRR